MFTSRFAAVRFGKKLKTGCFTLSIYPCSIAMPINAELMLLVTEWMMCFES